MRDGRVVVDEIREQHPEWLDAVAACLRAVNETGMPDRRFLGSVARLYLTSPRPNFSPLVTWGLLEVLDRSRRNTSYRFVDEAGARQGMEPVRRH
jgi:hypothetical protein